jgi:hypothetical protein
LCQKRQFFRKIFRREYLKNHNIGPWSSRSIKASSEHGRDALAGSESRPVTLRHHSSGVSSEKKHCVRSFSSPGFNRTTSIYNATGSLVRFENKNIFIYFKNALAYYNAGVAAVN